MAYLPPLQLDLLVKLQPGNDQQRSSTDLARAFGLHPKFGNVPSVLATTHQTQFSCQNLT
jgi:hypothetical protein